MLQVLFSYDGQIFDQNALFFIILDCVNQRKTLFYLKASLGNNFSQT